MIYDAVVVGTGLAGLTAAVRLAESGRRVLVLAKGIGSTHLSSGTVDVLGYVGDERIAAAGAAIARLGDDHPYARVGGAAAVGESLAWLRDHFPAPYAYAGDLSENWLLPTAVGAFKPTALLPATMAAGDLRSDRPMCIVSFRALRDFHPAYAADNLTRGGVPARGITLELPLGRRPDENALGMARRFDDPAFRAEVATALVGRLEPEERVGFPAGLGAADAATAWREMQDRLERPVFEIPTLPPSVPGIRLYRVLEAALKQAGGRIIVNSEVLGFDGDVVRAQAAGRPREYPTAWLVVATGGFASGGLELDAHWQARETVLGLPLAGVPADGDRRFGPRYFGEQPMARAGVAVDDGLRPVDAGGERLWETVLVVGGALAGAASWKEKSGDGIALASGHHAAGLIADAGEPVAARETPAAVGVGAGVAAGPTGMGMR